MKRGFSRAAMGLAALSMSLAVSAQAVYRDFARLDSIEQAYLRYERDYQAAPAGSLSERAADQARRQAASDLRYEADYAFLREANGEFQVSLERGLRYERAYQAAPAGAFKESVYKGLTEVAFDGVGADIRAAAYYSNFSQAEAIVRQMYDGYYRNSNHLEAMYLKVFNIATAEAFRALSIDLQRMSYQERYELERRLADQYQRASAGSRIETFYRQAVEIAHRGGGAPGPGPGPFPQPIPQPQPQPQPSIESNIVLSGTSTGGIRVSATGGNLSLAIGDAIVIRGTAVDQFGRQMGGSPLSGRIEGQSEAIQVVNPGDGTVRITAVALTRQARAAVAIEGRIVAGPRTLRLSIQVTRPPFRGFSDAQAREIVTRAYEAVLWRSPDAEGAQAYINAVKRGGIEAWKNALKGMAESPEGRAAAAQQTPEAILERLYERLLGPNRPVDPLGRSTYLPMIQQGRIGEAAASIGSSDEFLDLILAR